MFMRLIAGGVFVNGRWTMDWFGIRPDPASVQLASVLPNTSLPGLWLCLLPLWIKYKLSGKYFVYPRLPPPDGAEAIADLVIARTLYDPGRKTVFLWEGVTLYLGEDDVRKTLRGVREHAAPGSVLVADVYGERMFRTSWAGRTPRDRSLSWPNASCSPETVALRRP